MAMRPPQLRPISRAASSAAVSTLPAPFDWMVSKAAVVSVVLMACMLLGTFIAMRVVDIRKLGT